MPEITLVKMPDGKLRGFGADAEEHFEKFKRYVDEMGAGELVKFRWKRDRSLPHHNKFMALVRFISESSERFDDMAKAEAAVKIAAGHCDYRTNPLTGELFPVPRSIDFDSMDQNDFNEFYVRALDGITKHILPYMTRIDMQRALDEINRFS